MANLEYIHFSPIRPATTRQNATFSWDAHLLEIHRLPQIFWNEGVSWTEVNLWALDKIQHQQRDIETVNNLLKHLQAYASYLENLDLDWRHFPTQISKRPVYIYRGELMTRIKDGTIAGSTARARMSAIIQFYRFAQEKSLIQVERPMWTERNVKIQHIDVTGFIRSITRKSTDLTIPNKVAPGVRLEDGLTPLNELHMMELINFTALHSSEELHLILTTGFFTGARLGTITNLRIENLEQARQDQYVADLYLVSVGPGTKVHTKFDVSGDLLVPGVLLRRLKQYAYSATRLKRECNATKTNSSLLFITNRGNPYTRTTIGVLMTKLRQGALKNGLQFMASFKFHQTRATYGTWLMKMCLEVAPVGAAIEFVRMALLHRNEATTLKYVKFLECTAGKQKAAQEFYDAFSGLQGRDWNQYKV